MEKLSESAKNVASVKGRATTQTVTDDQIKTVLTANSKFGVKLFTNVGEASSNKFMSPYSISTALTMTLAGADGNTLKEMKAVLEYETPEPTVHAALNTIDATIRSSIAKSKSKLAIANSLWGQKDYKFVDKFLDLLAEYYGAGLKLVDFKHDPEGCRKIVNAWVAEQTKEKINELLPDKSVDDLTRLILVNAIYFKADWENQFDPKLTTPSEFNLLDGSTKEVQMMSRDPTKFDYISTPEYELIRLPYVGHDLFMTIILPPLDKFAAFAGGLKGESLFNIVTKTLTPSKVRLSLPKFKVSLNFSLAELLRTLGMKEAFSDSAQFSRMSAADDLKLSGVYHSAWIEVDEKGSEAAAATAVVAKLRGMAKPEPIVEMRVDHPFIFVIHNVQGSQLFLGQVVKP